MNPSDYIASGILEAFVMDELNPKEAKAVQHMARLYPEIQEEIDKIETTLHLIAFECEKETRPDLLNQISKKIDLESSSVRPNLHSYWKVAAVISGIVTIATITLYVITAGRLYDANDRITELIEQQSQLAQNLENTSSTLFLSESIIASLTDDSTYEINLVPQIQEKETTVKIYWNPNEKSVFLLSTQLPQIQDNEDFQLWYILDGKPYNAGIISFSNLPQKMIEVAHAQAFAITIEPKGGSKSPTLDQLIAVGTIS